MVIAIDSSLLLAWSQQKAGLTNSTSSATGSSSATAAAPAAPWQTATSSTSSSSSSSTSNSTSTTSSTSKPSVTSSTTTSAPAPLSATAQAALFGGKFFDPSAAKLSVTGASNATNQNYRDLFALYQGLDSLNQIAQHAASPNLPSYQLKQYQTAFTNGMTQLETYLQQAQFSGMQVAQGKVQASEQSTVGVAQSSDTYTGGTIYTGAMNGEAPAFQGDVAFQMAVTGPSGAVTNVNFDLSDMGDTPRTMGNVVNYLNGQLQTAGVAVRFTDNFTPGAPQTIQVGGKTVNLSDTPDQFGLQLTGLSIDSVSLSAPASSPAVYVAETSGNASGTTPDATQQLVKLQTDPTTGDAAAGDKISTTALGSEVQNALATATAPDGSVYVLANVNGTTNGQTIQGQQDVALMKYDSAGHLLFTQTLGAGDSASGYALSVSADGSKVAVAGTVQGELEGTDTPDDSSVSNTFVSVFNSAGEEQWTARGGSAEGDQPSAVAFGPDGSVYVTGQTQSVLPGATSQGGADGYLEGFTPTGAQKFATEFGSSGTDSTGGIAVSGSSVYVAGVENGHAVVRQYSLQSSGAPVLAASQDLGDLQGGNIAGIGVNADGSIVVAGSTHNAALTGGQVGSAYQSGKDAFVATLQAGLGDASSDTISFYQGDGDTTATKMTLSGGQAYLTGQVTGPVSAASDELNSQTGFAAQIDPASGTVGWATSLQGADDLSQPNAIAVDPTGASVLDLLGLPNGAVGAQPSQLLTAATSLRAGDSFSILSGSGGLAQKVTIDANDTLQTLATKIQRASDFQLTATVLTTNGQQQLKLAPVNPRTQAQLIAGPNGSDALGPLGLTEGVLTNPPTPPSSSSTSKSSSASTTVTNPSYSLNLSSTLGLGNLADAQAASTALTTAINTVKTAYTVLSTPPKPANSTSSGTVPTWLSNELANYQAGLARLTAGQSTSTSSSTSSTSSDPNSALLSLF